MFPAPLLNRMPERVSVSWKRNRDVSSFHCRNVAPTPDAHASVTKVKGFPGSGGDTSLACLNAFFRAKKSRSMA